MTRPRELNPMGREHEEAVADLLLANGWSVIVARDYIGHVGRAPLIHIRRALDAAMTDLVAINPSEGTLFLEVKAKTRPGKMRIFGNQLTHGVDLASFQDYQAIRRSTRAEVYLIVAELPCPENRFERTHLIAHVDKLEQRHVGHRARNWPRKGGAGSRDRKGGWCWLRSAMDRLDPTAIRPPKVSQLPLL